MSRSDQGGIWWSYRDNDQHGHAHKNTGTHHHRTHHHYHLSTTIQTQVVLRVANIKGKIQTRNTTRVINRAKLHCLETGNTQLPRMRPPTAVKHRAIFDLNITIEVTFLHALRWRHCQ